MEAGIPPQNRQNEIRTPESGPSLARLCPGLVEAAQDVTLSAKSEDQLRKLSATLPEPDAKATISIEHMKQVLRAEDCLYDKKDIWRRLGATEVPDIPDAVIREAYERGGRVIFRCSSIYQKGEALESLQAVSFWENAKWSHYKEPVLEPRWIVVPSHIDPKTLGFPRWAVVAPDKPAPSSEDWFSAMAYARFDGGRQPKGCEGLRAFTGKGNTTIGARKNSGCINVVGDISGRRGGDDIGAARFGPPRNSCAR